MEKKWVQNKNNSSTQNTEMTCTSINSSTAVCYLSTAWKKSGRGPASFSGWSLSALSFFMLPRNSSSLMAMPSAFSSFPAALA